MLLPSSQAELAGQAELLCEKWVGDIRVTHKCYTHDFAQTWHSHPAGTIDYVLQGGGVGTYAGREIESSPGMVEFFREDIRHRFRSHPRGIRSMHVVLPERFLRGLPQLRHTAVQALRHSDAMVLATKLLSELHTNDPSSPIQIESLVYELIDEVTNYVARREPRAGWLGQARMMLSDSLLEPISLSDVAAEVQIDRSHLARTFKARMGLSVGEYHRRLRIQRVAGELAGSDQPISGIACRFGFADQAHLTRIFRAWMGITPARYRLLLRRR